MRNSIGPIRSIVFCITESLYVYLQEIEHVDCDRVGRALRYTWARRALSPSSLSQRAFSPSRRWNAPIRNISSNAQTNLPRFPATVGAGAYADISASVATVAAQHSQKRNYPGYFGTCLA